MSLKSKEFAGIMLVSVRENYANDSILNALIHALQAGDSGRLTYIDTQFVHADFSETQAHLQQALSESRVLVLVIDAQWQSAIQLPQNARVRYLLETAFALNKQNPSALAIYPVYINCLPIKAEQLPPTLSTLANFLGESMSIKTAADAATYAETLYQNIDNKYPAFPLAKLLFTPGKTYKQEQTKVIYIRQRKADTRYYTIIIDERSSKSREIFDTHTLDAAPLTVGIHTVRIKPSHAPRPISNTLEVTISEADLESPRFALYEFDIVQRWGQLSEIKFYFVGHFQRHEIEKDK